MTTINANNVEQCFLHCLFSPEEVKDGKIPAGAAIVEGVMVKYAFHPVRLAESRSQVESWLGRLPLKFKANGGGGASFLEACYDNEGELWTGLHKRMEQLFCLGMGLKLVSCPLPRKLWSALPGGMPYYIIGEGEKEPKCTSNHP